MKSCRPRHSAFYRRFTDARSHSITCLETLMSPRKRIGGIYFLRHDYFFLGQPRRIGQRLSNILGFEIRVVGKDLVPASHSQGDWGDSLTRIRRKVRLLILDCNALSNFRRS